MSAASKQNKQAEIDFFNKFGARENDFDAYDEHGYQRLIREFAAAVPRSPESRVADLGCGTGVFTKRLHDAGYRVVGIDIAPQCVGLAREKYPAVQFEAGDIESLPYPDGTFDAISLFGVFHHFPDLGGVLKSCRRLLKPGGVLFSLDPNRGNPFYFLYHNPSSPFYARKTLTENERLLSRSDLRRALSEAGFEDPAVYAIAGVTLNSGCKKYSPFVKLVAPVYNFIEYFMDFTGLGGLAGSALISISRKKST